MEPRRSYRVFGQEVRLRWASYGFACVSPLTQSSRGFLVSGGVAPTKARIRDTTSSTRSTFTGSLYESAKSR